MMVNAKDLPSSRYNFYDFGLAGEGAE